MKKNDIALIIFVVVVTALVTYLGAQSLIGSKVGKPVAVEAVDVIDPAVTEPSPKVFNKEAINPTVKIEIGDVSNQSQPFNN